MQSIGNKKHFFLHTGIILGVIAPLIGCTSQTTISGNLRSITSTFSGSSSSSPANSVFPAGGKSIKQWTACDGKTDDSIGAAKAFMAARNKAFILVVDCVVNLKIGSDIERPLFIDNGTTIKFINGGKFIVDNLFVPAFVIAGSHDVSLLDWNVEFNGSMPVSLETGGYTQGGVFHPIAGANSSGQFNDITLTNWLTTNRGINFDYPDLILSNWQGSVNTSAIFFIIGETSYVKIDGLNLYAPSTATPDHFIPFGFMLAMNFKNNFTVTHSTPTFDALTAGQAFVVPNHLTMSNINLDGLIMGFQGSTQNSTFTNIVENRYSDLQDANGQNVGGIGHNFPPPHLFYLNMRYDGDPSLFNRNIQITNVQDLGPRLGVDRFDGGGYANSLKLGCFSCSVDGYVSHRKDGFMDVLLSDGLSVSNVSAVYDSSFIHNMWPGWRWPGGSKNANFKNMTFTNVTLTDEASVTSQRPMGDFNGSTNTSIDFVNVNVTVNKWGPGGSILPTAAGLTSDSMIQFIDKSNPANIQYLK